MANNELLCEEMTEEEKQCINTIGRCWKYIPERTKGYMLGAAEANAERELMLKKKDETEEVRASAE